MADKVLRYYQRISPAIEKKSQVQMVQKGGAARSVKKEKSMQGSEKEAYKLTERCVSSRGFITTQRGKSKR